MGVGGGGRNGLSQRAARKPVVNFRSDTLPDWRPAPGSFERAAKPAPAAHSVEDADLEAQPAGTGSGLERLLNVRFWPLAVVLAIQAALSLRLVWSATAFLDEGEYLTVGRLELAHFLHHAPMPNVATYLSGSPVVYPPLAAIADDIGGLAGARLLSLVFMLIATTALHGVTRRLLSSRPAAFYAAALFAWLGTAEFLGAFATYDAMALMLLAVATWLGVRAIDADYWLRYGLLCAAGLSIALADAAKYASTLFNPVVIGVVLLAAWRADGRRTALDAAGAMLLAAAVPLTVGYDVGGSPYGAGDHLDHVRPRGQHRPVRPVLNLSANATGIVAVLAVLGAIVIIVRRPGWATVLLACTLAGAEFLAPAEQARIHTLTSLFKHVGYGAWFACVIGGYLLAELPGLLARLSRAARAAGAGVRPRWALAAGTAIGRGGGAGGRGVRHPGRQRPVRDWPNSRPMIAELSKLVTPSGYYMVEDPSVATYYLGTKVPFSTLTAPTPTSYTDPQTHKLLMTAAAFADSIKRGYFTDIVLAFGDTFAPTRPSCRT